MQNQRRGLIRGHEVVWNAHRHGWDWSDTGLPADDKHRACAFCGRLPTERGADPCIGDIPGAHSACCGHGREPGYITWTGAQTTEMVRRGGWWEGIREAP